MKVLKSIEFRRIDIDSIPAGGHDDVGYVYIIGDGNLTKIGKSTKPQARIKHLISSLSIQHPVIFISQAHSKFSESEKIMHKEYAESRIHGEWFSIDSVAISGIEYKIPLGRKCIDHNKDTNFKRPSCLVRIKTETYETLREKTSAMCDLRAKAGKKPITMDDAIYLALEQLTVEMGVAK